MATTLIEDARITWRRGTEPGGGDFVLYWMQQAQRTRHNPALEYAVQLANDADQPLMVLFCVATDYPESSARHMLFMLQGLNDVEAALRRRSIGFEALVGAPDEVIAALEHRCSAIVFDTGYMPIQRQWRDAVEAATSPPIAQVEGDVVVPVDLVSDKAETAARTIRPKIESQLERFVVELSTSAVSEPADGLSLARTAAGFARVEVSNPQTALDDLDVRADPGPVTDWIGGQNRAAAALRTFVSDVLPDYDNLRNRYDLDASSSLLSPYLHFGQISPITCVLAAWESQAPDEHVESFVDEIVVRRELAVNFVLHNSAHDRFGGLPDWARETLKLHETDDRPDILTASELAAGETDDEVWNTIMKVIREQGWVHNQLRMYWGKQILQWTNTPTHAFTTLLELNNRYFLDGRDPNSHANVGWCFGLHDQGFKERPILGKVRPFTDAALKRKGDLSGWIDANS